MHLICAGRETGRRVDVCAEVALFLARCHFFIALLIKYNFCFCAVQLQLMHQWLPSSQNFATLLTCENSTTEKKIYNQMTMLVFVKDQKRQRELEWDSLRTLYTHLIPNQKKYTFLGSNAT